MPSGKIYAVRSGRAPGFYDTWDECRKQVDGYPGAEYKSFRNRGEAEKYMRGAEEPAISGQGYEYPLAFVDGSYNPGTGIYGYGGFVSVSRSESYAIQGSGNDPGKASMRNVAGEIEGALAAVEKALSLGLRSLTIYYDYEGVARWADGSWKCTRPGTKAYSNAMRGYMSKISLKFIHVNAHTGVPGNELADRMAKQAVGIE